MFGNCVLKTAWKPTVLLAAPTDQLGQEKNIVMCVLRFTELEGYGKSPNLGSCTTTVYNHIWQGAFWEA